MSSSAGSSVPAAAPSVRYREVLSLSPGAWAAAMVIPIGLALCVLPLGLRVSTVVLVVALVVTVVLLRHHAGVVEVYDQGGATVLRAGRANIETRNLGGARAYWADEADAQRRHLLDPRAFLMLRGWIGGVVKVDLDDPADPTPYWLISSRHPDALARVINEVSGEG